MVAPQQCHACRWEKNADVALLYVERGFYDRLLPHGLPAGATVVPLLVHDLAWCQLANALRSFGTTHEGRQGEVMTSISIALATYAAELLGRAPLEPGRRLSDARFCRIAEFVAAHLGGNICTDDMAAHVGYSVPYLSKLFKAAKGITPAEYLFRERMEKAKELMQTGNYTIGAAARKVSYVDQGNFAEKFRDYHGVSAKQVIGKARLKSAESSDRPKIS
jgi:AraC family transcriptional regulator